MKKLLEIALVVAVSFVLGSAARADNIDDGIERLKSPEKDVREEAAEYLGSVGDERAVEALIEAMTDPEDDVREEAAKALGKIGGPESISILIQALQDDDVGVRGKAVTALGKIGDEHAIEPLQEIAASTWNPLLSKAAAKSIMQIKARLPKE